MAFHVACPITCRRICNCTLGAPPPLQTSAGRHAFLQDVLALESLLSRPGFLASGGEESIEVLVPRLARDLKPKKKKITGGPLSNGRESTDEISLSERVVMRKKVTMAAIAVAEAAALAEQAKRSAGCTGQVICGMCLLGEAAGSKKAERMISCPVCKKLYHRNCLKRWAANRDLFNWTSWACASCRICEVCRRTGEPNKLMFCKRCDRAYHAYCQQPQLKQVPKGPFLCPKHTHCHSCGSHVPGSGASSRWFLGYTTCDPCGRLFMKRKYCPICLKVYRDSETSPMVCCDTCERWVHCRCDGISDEKYREFQLDNELHYKCAACRGDCYQVKETSDAANELWRRRDAAERHLIAQLQASAGLPSKEQLLSLCPSSDEDGDDRPSLHGENRVKKPNKDQFAKDKDKYGKPLKLSLSLNKTNDKVDKPDVNKIIKKLKFTMMRPDVSNPHGPSKLENATESKQSLKVTHNGSHDNEMSDRKTMTTVNLIKPGNERPKDSEEFSSVKEEGTSVHSCEITAPANQGFSIVSSSSCTDARVNRSNRTENHQDSLPVKSIKFFKDANNNASRILLPVSLKEKRDISRVKTKGLLAAMLTEGDTEDMLANHSSDDAEGIEGLEEDSLASVEEKPTTTGAHHQILHERNPKEMIAHEPTGITPVHSWGLHAENVKRRRIPSSKFRDMDTSVWKSAKAVKENNVSSVNISNSEGLHKNEHMKSEQESNHTSSGRQGVASRVRKERDLISVAVPVNVIQDEDLLRKKVKFLDSKDRQLVEESKEVADTGNYPSKVSLKLKLKKPITEGIVHDSIFNKDEEKQLDEGSFIKGNRSKRKRNQPDDI